MFPIKKKTSRNIPFYTNLEDCTSITQIWRIEKKRWFTDYFFSNAIFTKCWFNFFFYLSAFLFHLNAHKRLNISFDIRAQSLLLHQMLTFQKSMKIKPCFDVKVTFCYFCISSYEVRHFLLLHCTECDILAIHKRQKDKRCNKFTAYYVYCLRYFDYILSHQFFSSYHVLLTGRNGKLTQWDVCVTNFIPYS